MSDALFDLAVIGGGINGAGIAADAAGRGLKVVLFEKGDLAGGTSSASSKLIHGGLRYLEHWEFRLVREALAEREVLLQRAPHLIWPLRFVIPHARGMRPRALLRIGLALYDRLAARRLIPASGELDLTRDPAGRPLRPEMHSGFSYYDCWADDARLVIAAALDARERGASIRTRTPVTQIARVGDEWRVTASSPVGVVTVRARALVNAAGPWCAEVAGLEAAQDRVPKLRLVRGSHIVVPRIAGADDAYLLQNGDGRVVFALPFEQRFTLIGTTDVSVSTPDDGFLTSAEEEDYLLAAAARFFAQPLARDDIVWRFAGVRPLVDDGTAKASAVSRDYRLDLIQPPGGAPLVNVIGGKITTFRRLAEAVLARLAPTFPGMGPAWTAQAPLPGGDFGPGGVAGYRQALLRRYSGISPDTLGRLVQRYGTRADLVLGGAQSDGDLGPAIGSALTAAEVLYLRDHEWALTADDVLWRRTKAGLHIAPTQRAACADHVAALLGSSGADAP
ncbi:glycerol-3-phosphate dehydrogenase [Hyphomicrobium sp.]|uniref:glycerol-3-phosphate dehydrogenase n=1 Tax=Hyphomicrobium sp. TaxID=82 RepID=UPI003F6EBD7E